MCKRTKLEASERRKQIVGAQIEGSECQFLFSKEDEEQNERDEGSGRM